MIRHAPLFFLPVLLLQIPHLLPCAAADATTAVAVDHVVSKTPLPKDLDWQTNEKPTPFAAPDAKKGGTYRTFISSFPLTLRTVGPDSNGSFCSYLRNINLSLVAIHSNTEELVPSLATHWAYDKDQKTVYYKLDPRARWSDGQPIRADDYLFALEFMRSKYIQDPWCNDNYTKELLEVRKYDDLTISITGRNAKPRKDLHYYYSLNPLPRHFYHLDENFIKNYNWKAPPVSGPYMVDERKLEKGKSVTFVRVKDWWAQDLPFYKNRFNVDVVKFIVIRDINVAFEYFKKGEIDNFTCTLPEYWHEKLKGDVFDKGYVVKEWFYTDAPQPQMGLFVNTAHPILKDLDVRLGLAYALNIELMLKTLLRGDYFRLQHGYVGYGPYTNNAIKALPFDLDKANEHLVKAGWSRRGPDGIRVKDGQRLAFTVSFPYKHHAERLALLREEAKKAGIELNLELLDPSACFKKLLEKKHELDWGAYGTGFRPAYWEFYHSENANKPQTNNVTNTADPKLDALIDRARASVDEAEVIALGKEIQAIIHNKCVFIPSYMAPYFRETYWRYVKLPKVASTRVAEEMFDPTEPGLFWIDGDERKNTIEAMKTGRALIALLVYGPYPT